MINQIINIVGQAGSTWSQPLPGYYNQAQQQSALAYQQALHGITPGIQMASIKWMFDGTPMSLAEFAQKAFGEDEQARTMFLLKYSK